MADSAVVLTDSVVVLTLITNTMLVSSCPSVMQAKWEDEQRKLRARSAAGHAPPSHPSLINSPWQRLMCVRWL